MDIPHSTGHFYLWVIIIIGFSRQGFSVASPGTSSCRPGWPRTHRDPPAYASRVLGLKVCTTTTWPCGLFLKMTFS
ncbi:hypothetical protein LEMLEM_LOCUS23756 [Lemmus lemmus]